MRAQHTHHNQRGLSSILFAMIFAIILSLLAVGFVTLVRNDQRQTLDQTLGAQAQYAAETAINQVVAGLYSPTSPLLGKQIDCKRFEIEFGSGVSVPCVTWTDESYDVRFQSVDFTPKKAKIKISDNDIPPKFNRPTIIWSSDDFGVYSSSELNANGFPKTILSDKLPVIRFTFTNLLMPSPKTIYLVPSDDSLPDSEDYDDINLNATTPSGYVANVNCSNTKNHCAARLINYVQSAVTNLAYISVAAIGQETDITLRFYQGNTKKLLSGAQYTIDATAIAQDITKRIQARIPGNPQTWRPSAGITADNFCKDIKMDGDNNNNKASDNSLGSCP